MRFLNPARHCLAIAFLHFCFQKCLKITEVRLLLLDCLFGQTRKLIAQCWQVQLPGILLDRSLLHRLDGGHWITSVASPFGSNRSYASRLGCGRSYRLNTPMSIGLAAGPPFTWGAFKRKRNAPPVEKPPPR